MKNLILSAAEWLTSLHGMTLPGWAWLALGAASFLLILVIGFGLFYWMLLLSEKPKLW